MQSTGTLKKTLTATASRANQLWAAAATASTAAADAPAASLSVPSTAAAISTPYDEKRVKIQFFSCKKTRSESDNEILGGSIGRQDECEPTFACARGEGGDADAAVRVATADFLDAGFLIGGGERVRVLGSAL